jgi:hypothetical protein
MLPSDEKAPIAYSLVRVSDCQPQMALIHSRIDGLAIVKGRQLRLLNQSLRLNL